MGAAVGMELALYAIGCRTQGVGALDGIHLATKNGRDWRSPSHPKCERLDIRTAGRQGGSGANATNPKDGVRRKG